MCLKAVEGISKRRGEGCCGLACPALVGRPLRKSLILLAKARSQLKHGFESRYEATTVGRVIHRFTGDELLEARASTSRPTRSGSVTGKIVISAGNSHSSGHVLSFDENDDRRDSNGTQLIWRLDMPGDDDGTSRSWSRSRSPRVCTVLVDIGTAQDEYVLIEGRVLWVAGSTMIVAPSGSGATGAVNVDLSAGEPRRVHDAEDRRLSHREGKDCTRGRSASRDIDTGSVMSRNSPHEERGEAR
jgi:hypothetical protein